MEHIFVMATQLHPTSPNQILKIIYLIVTYHEMQTKATLMIGTPVAVQKHLRNQKKKDLSQKKEKNAITFLINKRKWNCKISTIDLLPK